MHKQTFKSVSEYIGLQIPSTQALLKQLRECILKAAPKAEEGISYQMPAYKLNGPVVYFAAYKNHIGLYPTASGINEFEKELSTYKTSKGAIQFPLDKKLPLTLITKIVKFKVKENLEKTKLKSGKKAR